MNISYQKFSLDNGLKVVFHEDHSNPVVALSILYHVGSARELQGKTGFAHLFEHLMFQRSEHVERNRFFSMIDNLGGTFNGGTWEDGTIYYESVPNDALEKLLWLESDRMGYFINTVTEAGLSREKDIVINEKRQTYNNRPYGRTDEIIRRALYPVNHPYHHSVIGSIDDIRSTTLNDVRQFHENWYQPNNCTLVLSGDFDTNKTLELVKKYFGEIASTQHDYNADVAIPHLQHDVYCFYEDKFIKTPELNVVFATAEQYNKDAYAVSMLCELMSSGKKSPLYCEIVDRHIAPKVTMYTLPKEISGETYINLRTLTNVSLDQAYSAIMKAFAKFESQNVDADELERVKKMYELQIYLGLNTNLDKAMNLAQADVFTGSPDIVNKEPEIIRSINKDDIMEVYEKYFKQHCVVSSVVPTGKQNYAVSNSIPAEVEKDEETLHTDNTNDNAGTEELDEEFAFSPSSFDRTKEPPLDVLHDLNTPHINEFVNKAGVKILNIVNNDLPLVGLSFVINAGTNDCEYDKAGAAMLCVGVLKEGTATKTPSELETMFKNFGCELVVNSYPDYLTFSVVCLAKDFTNVASLVKEVITAPRWDQKEFDRLKKGLRTKIKINNNDPVIIASDAFYKSILGDNILSLPLTGTETTVSSLTIEDLKDFYHKTFTSQNCSIAVVGNIATETVQQFFGDFQIDNATVFEKRTIEIVPETGFLHKTTFTGAEQSIIMIGNKVIPRNEEDYLPLYVANYKLGKNSGGILFNVLRLQHGYTYGAYSSVTSMRNFGVFKAYSKVESTYTQHSLELFCDIIREYKKNYGAEDLEQTKIALLRKEACSYESLSSLIDVIADIVVYDLPLNYVENDIAKIMQMDLDTVKTAIDKYINLDNMKCTIVGDDNVISNVH